MPKQKLSDRQFISGITLTDLLHFVVTGDTSQSPAGSSYKGSVEQLFNGFSSYTCTYPLIVDTVNSCSGGITINGDVTINGSATTINTQIIQSLDNNIVLNYSGTHLTAIGGGITVEDGQSDGVDSIIFTDTNGFWLFDPGLSASTGTIDNFTADTISVTTIGSSGNCVDDLYVSNIHSCSPININPLDEGNVYFGSTSGVTIDVINSRLGIGITTPDRRLVVSGDYATFYVDTDRQDPLSLTQPGERVLFVGNPSGATRISISTETNVGVAIGQVGSLATNPNLGIFGNPYDTFIRSNSNANNLNIITGNGGGKEDSIRFYAKLLGNVSGSTSSLHIQGSGSTKGYIGINNDNPTERLDVRGNTKINGTLNISTLGTGTTISNLGIDSNGFVVSGVTGNLLYTQTNNYTLGVPITINHNLNTTDVLVQVVDANTNQLIYGSINNYQTNSLDVTLSISLNNVKVLVIGSPISQIVPKGSIVYTLGHNSISPTDNNNYYIGQNFSLAPITSSNDGRRFIVQKTGTITQLSIMRAIGGTLGSSETNSFYINNVTQITQNLVTSGETFNVSSSLNNYILPTPLNVTAGDKIEIEWDTPAWATNPTTVRHTFNMIIEY